MIARACCCGLGVERIYIQEGERKRGGGGELKICGGGKCNFSECSTGPFECSYWHVFQSFQDASQVHLVLVI